MALAVGTPSHTAATQPAELLGGWGVPSPDPESSPGNESCAGCCVQLLGKTCEHPALCCFPPGILEATARRKGRLEEAVSVRIWSF